MLADLSPFSAVCVSTARRALLQAFHAPCLTFQWRLLAWGIQHGTNYQMAKYITSNLHSLLHIGLTAEDESEQ